LYGSPIYLFYRGRKGDRSIGELGEEDKYFWRTGAPSFILGIIPVTGITPLKSVNITGEGSKMGLRVTWSGLRPIAIDRERVLRRLFLFPRPKDKEITVLAKSRYLVASPWIRSEKKWRFGIRRVEVSVTPKIEVAPKEVSPELHTYWKTYANAWFKNFNEQYPLSGFIRIWDYSPRILTYSMLEDLRNIATCGLE